MVGSPCQCHALAAGQHCFVFIITRYFAICINTGLFFIGTSEFNQLCGMEAQCFSPVLVTVSLDLGVPNLQDLMNVGGGFAFEKVEGQQQILWVERMLRPR